MTNRTILFEAEIDGKKFKGQLTDLKNQGDKAFGGATKGAKSLGVQMGITAGITTALATAFIDLASNAVSAFADIAKQAVELNKEAELTRISLTQVFGGNEKAADAFIDKVKEVSIQLGVSRSELTGLAKGILPDVGSADQTLEIVKNITILGKDAAQSVTSIRIAAEEALSGNLSSLQRRLNIPKSTIASIERYAETMSFAEAVSKGLADQVQKAGLSAESTADSLSTVQGRLENQLEDLQRAFGTSIGEELKEQFKEIGQALQDNNPEIQRAVEAFGDLAAQVVELVGSGITDFIKNVDLKGIEEFADTFSDLVTTAELFLDTLDIPDAFNSMIEGATSLLGTLQEALFIAAQLSAIVKIEAAEIEARFQKRVELGITDQRGRTRRGITDEDQAAIDAAGEEARRAVIEKSITSFEKHTEQLKENENQTEDRRKAVEAGTDADLAAGDAFLLEQKRLRELAEAEDAAAKAKEKIADATEKANKAREDSNLNLEIRQQRRLTDALIDNARAREDIARGNAQEIEDINRDHRQDIADEAKDLSRQEQQIARDGARRQAQIARDEANQRVDIERDFRQQLESIRRTFEQSALEAERANDVQAFLQAQRTRDNAIENAETNRSSQLEDSRNQAQEQRAALKVELQNEIADAREANQQKLEDLRARLAQEFEEQRIKNQREIEEQLLTEQRKEADRLERNARELADFDRLQASKLERLEASLKKEFDLIAEFEQKKLSLAESARRKRVAFAASTPLQRAVTAGQAKTGRGVQQFLADGGTIGANTTAIVGERGPELFIPNTAGRVVPNNQLFSPPAMRAMMGGITNNSTVNSPQFNLSESAMNDPMFKRQLETMILRVLS